MSDKFYEYVGFFGWLHGLRDNLRERWVQWKERNPEGVLGVIKKRVCTPGNKDLAARDPHEDYSHIYRRKTRRELIRVSAAVMGIEFSYAAETAFVSPTLLKIGVEHQHMTLVWALSPLIGFFLTPVLGSLSDRCPLRVGRRRPFIFFMSVGVLLGLLLVPNGESLGYAMGDQRFQNSSSVVATHRTTTKLSDVTNRTVTNQDIGDMVFTNSHPWGVLFTVLGTVLLDFDADACQSPARAYLLDVTIPDDHARGLSTFTIMAGLGGFFGYALGGINWDITALGILLGGHVKAVFTLITFIFIICVTYTITSFKEMPLYLLEMRTECNINGENANLDICGEQGYGTLKSPTDENNEADPYKQASQLNRQSDELEFNDRKKSIIPSPDASLIIYLKSIIYMPHSIRMVCLTNLFCWMAHVCYSLYFTDFVGEAVFGGNPTGKDDDPERELYESGVRFGCWGMSMYSLSCACYSTIIEKLITRFGAKKVYIGGLLVYSTGMCLMAITKHKIGVIIFSWTAGVMYSTLFTMPYLLIAHYHAKNIFELNDTGEVKISGQIRGLGTDVAIVSSMVFLAQFILSICMGTIVSISNTTTAVVSVASFLAFLGAISATQVMYLDL